MTSLKERVELLLKKRGISQAEATRRGGFTNPAFINDIVRGHKESVRGVNLERLARALHTSETYLLGKTDLDEPLQAIKDRVIPIDIAESERQAGYLVERAPHTIPEIDLRAGASYGGGVDDQEWNIPIGPDEKINGHRAIASWGLPPAFVERELGLSFGHADIIQIRGDSMDDGTVHALVSGDRVIVDRMDTDPRQGGVFAVWDGDGVIVKQVELLRGTEPVEIICKSRNKHYDPIRLIIDGNVHIIGRVAGKISRM